MNTDATAEQALTTKKLFEQMHAEAKALGEELMSSEYELNPCLRTRGAAVRLFMRRQPKLHKYKASCALRTCSTT
jgi:hypothetical protein